jgi:hypothetical protein
MAALMFAACAMLIQAEAGAKGLEIVVTSTSSVVPAHLVLTASASSAGDPIVAYDWTTLDVSPRCRTAHCAIDIAIASCRRVEIQATTVLGDTLTATKSVCIGDDKGRPPNASFTMRDPLTAVTNMTAATDRIAIVRRWLDDRSIAADPVSIPNDGACHALDLLVSDAKGRIALDRRSICTSTAAPILWMGAAPSPFVVAGQKMKLCAEGVDPLGGTLEKTSGDVPLDGCTPDSDPPSSIVRDTLRARRGRGVESTASIFVALAPAQNPRTLLFADLPFMPNAVAGDEVMTELDVVGGLPPYTIAVTVTPPSGRALAGSADPVDAAGKTQVHVPAQEAGMIMVDVVVRDARGLAASAQTTVNALPKSGSPDGGSSPPPSNGKVGCGGTLIVRDARAPIVELVLVLSAMIVARRRGRR